MTFNPAPPTLSSHWNGKDDGMPIHSAPCAAGFMRFATLTATVLALFMAAPACFPAAKAQEKDEEGAGWIALFDGETLDGWEPTDHPEVFQVVEGAIAAGGGPMAHLCYNGPVGNHDFTDFELRMEVKCKPGSNGGVFFHTAPQKGTLRKGYEAQIANTHADPRRTGSLVAVVDLAETPAQDDEWFEYAIRVEGKRITIKINGETVVDYVEPPNPPRPPDRKNRVLSSGTIALQAHDPNSLVLHRNIRIRLLKP
ncbi:protein of unknown function DUF1080 [Isosphaera pallida ATCC 43644]|uniref:3-keto-alpha-glucoside-1,2-lyase/3-keto-2-hydroxy-glucal hydratase domain-containing protein n=2 Tax=Isosphaera pallida TaxID=128 RepID=E8QZA5_ISOPI|nr:protein of unknown function DUF1080 [Isosphaera pallida ATCC 43644]